MRYYLAGPIDFDEEKIKTDWKTQLKEWCKQHPGIVLFDPDTFAFGSITKPVSEFIHDVNMSAIDHCDAIVARWMSGQMSVGTPMELYYATTIRKPIILITNMAKDSVYLNYVANKCFTVVSSIDQGYGAILRFDKEQYEQQRMLQGSDPEPMV